MVRLAWRLLGRDLRAGELRVLALALLLSVASVTSVGFFADRVNRALAQQARSVLGADLILSATQPLPVQLREAARARGLRVAETVEFPSMVVAGERLQLASIRAVSDGYPLRGTLSIASARFAAGVPSDRLPAPGTVWLAPELLGQLGVAVGDRVTLGYADFTVSAVLTDEPAAIAGSAFAVAPRLLMRRADLEQTRLLKPTSRIRYRVLFAGSRDQVSAWRRDLARRLSPGERLAGLDDAGPELRTALQRGERFLLLASLVTVLLAVTAIAMAARRFVARRLDHCAMLRCFGARQGEILGLFTVELLLIALAAGVIGAACGYLLQFGLMWLLGELAGLDLPPPSLWPLLHGLMTALLALLGFALPPLLQLRSVPALRVLRRELGGLRGSGLLAYLFGLAALVALIFLQTRDPAITLYVIGGVVGLLAVLTLLATALIVLLRRLVRWRARGWRHGIGNIVRRPLASLAQILALGVGVMALLLLGILRGDLIDEWLASLPAQAPNRFLINIQPDQVAPLQRFLAEHGRTGLQLYPMIRGRLTAIDGREVGPDSYRDERAQRLVAREFNLSYGEALAADNTVVAGRWWSQPPPTQGRAPQFSVEQGLAERLGIQLHDTLTFTVAGRTVSAPVTSLREVAWDSFRVNFFVLAPPALLADFPASYITSFYVPQGEQALLTQLVKRFPNITVIDVAALMDQVRAVIDRVSLAVQYVFAFTLLAGMLVMVAAIQATLDERIRDNAILRVLGGSRRQLQGSLMMEFAGTGLLAGCVAALGATLVAALLAERIFHIGYTLEPLVLLYGMGGGAAGAALVGMFGTRFILTAPPWQTLRDAA